MDKRIKQAVEHIKSHLDETFALDSLAKIAFLSPNYFHRLFKLNMGETPRDFVEREKIEASHALLLQSNLQIQDLAMKYGYFDYETFSRVYKRYYQVSPEDMRKIQAQATENGKYEMVSIVTPSDDEETILELIKNHPAFTSIENCENIDISVATCQKNETLDDNPKSSKKFAVTVNEHLSKQLLAQVKTS